MPATAKLQDPLLSPTSEFLENPYPIYNQFREEAPVWWSQSGKYWLVTRYGESLEILGDNQFEKRLHRWKQINPLIRILPWVQRAIRSRSAWMLNMDPPDHTRMRSLVNKAITPSTVAKLSPQVEQIAEGLLNDAERRGEIDLIQDYAFPLPVIVIAQMLGVPPEDRDIIRGYSHQMTSALELKPRLKNLRQASSAIEGFVDYLRPLVAERRKNPKDDLISSLIAAEESGNKLTEEELLQNCVLLLVAGHETTVNLIGNGLLNLLRTREHWEAVKADSNLIPGAVAETLRFDSPIQIVRRLAGEETILSGQKIKEGDMITIMLGAANRDPAVYTDPDTFDIRRPQKRNLAFGQGIHHCLGSSLAETEGRLALSVISKRMPNLTLKSDKFDWRNSVVFRGVNSLPATF